MVAERMFRYGAIPLEPKIGDGAWLGVHQIIRVR